MIVFARTRHNYESYHDFWQLVHLAGFQTCYVDEVDLSARVTFITTMVGQEWEQMCTRQERNRRYAHLILWNLERPAGWAKTVGGYNEKCHDYLSHRRFDEVWISDRRLAQETELRFVVLGSHPLLGQPSPMEDRRLAFCHLSNPTNRRVSVYKHFPPSEIGPNCWPPERDRMLRACKFALNVHQDDHPYQEPLRFALFAAYGLPILTETIYDSYPWSDEFMIYDKYPNLVARMLDLLKNRYERWYYIGMAARQRMVEEFEFGKVVRRAVLETTGDQ